MREEGLKAYVRDLNKGKPAVGEIVYFKKKVDDIEVEAAFQYVDEFQETIMDSATISAQWKAEPTLLALRQSLLLL